MPCPEIKVCILTIRVRPLAFASKLCINQVNKYYGSSQMHHRPVQSPRITLWVCMKCTVGPKQKHTRYRTSADPCRYVDTATSARRQLVRGAPVPAPNSELLPHNIGKTQQAPQTGVGKLFVTQQQWDLFWG